MGIGNILLELRSEQGISQQQLAEATGISQSTIAKIETGRNEATASTVRKLAKHFGVSADYILGLEDDFADMSAPPTAAQRRSAAGERELIKQYRRLSPSMRKLAVNTIRTWADGQQ